MEEKLNKLITDVEVIKTKMEYLTKNFPCTVHNETMEDHEGRLRTLEDFRSKFMGALLLGSAFGGFIGTVTGLIAAFFSK
jgi:hypothetical protein